MRGREQEHEGGKGHKGVYLFSIYQTVRDEGSEMTPTLAL